MQTKTELYNSVVALASGIEQHIKDGWTLNKDTPAGHYGLFFQAFFEKETDIVKTSVAKPVGKK